MAAESETLRPLIEGLTGFGDRTALLAFTRDGVEAWSYARLARTVGQAAAALTAGGVEHGDTVALLAPPSPEWVATCLGALQAGAVPLPLDTQFEPETLRHTLQDSETRLIATTVALSERFELHDRQLHLMGKPLAEGAVPMAEVVPDHRAALFYTSGTTGVPKGVPLTHRNLAFQIEAIRQAGFIGPHDRVLLPLPLHHVYPFVIGMLVPLGLGLPIILPASITGPELVRALREGQASISIGVPGLYRALLDGIESRAERGGWLAANWFRTSMKAAVALRVRFGLRAGRVLFAPLHRRIGPTLRITASGGAPLDPDLAWRMEAFGWSVAVGYGLTETSPLLTIDPPGTARIGSVGRVVPGIQLRIDETVPGAGDGKGEVQARGPGVFSGYLNLPGKSREAFTEDGWFRTGDLGWRDGDGYLYLAGRISTLMVTPGGENVQPETVEEAYGASTVIREIGVFQQDGRLVGLIVPERSEVVRGGGDTDALLREVIAARSRTLPSYQRLADFAVTAEGLPRTRLGKIRRHLLPERYEQARRGIEAAPGPILIDEMSAPDRELFDQPAVRAVWEWLAEHYADRRLTPDSSVALDLGVDSIGWLDLTLTVSERTGVELEDEAIARTDTVRDLLVAVRDARTGGGAVSPIEQPERALGEAERRWLEPMGPVSGTVSRALFAANRVVTRRLWRVRATGLERLPEGQIVLAPNHLSHLDPFILAAALPSSRLPAFFWAGWTGVAFNTPLRRVGSRLARALPIDPSGVRASLALPAAVLARGGSLVWFPEGMRAKDGRLQPFRPGLGLLLVRYPVTVVPVALMGTFEALPYGKAVPRLLPVEVRFGEPVRPERLEEEGTGDEAGSRILAALHARMERLLQ